MTTEEVFNKLLNDEQLCPTSEQEDKIALAYYQLFPLIKEEFDDLLKSDPKFNYKEHEFLSWVKDVVISI